MRRNVTLHLMPQVVLLLFENVARSPERQKQLVANARRMYHSRFEPSRIHAVLLRECEKLVRRQRH